MLEEVQASGGHEVVPAVATNQSQPMAETLTSPQVHDLAMHYLQYDGMLPVSSGLRLLDKHLEGGFLPGSIYTFGGRPGEGKTSLVLSIARRMAFEMGKRVIFVSLEMTSRELIERLLCQTWRKSVRQLREMRNAGLLADGMRPFLDLCRNASFRIEDDREGTLVDLENMFEELQSRSEPLPDVLIIDHLQHRLFNEGASRADAIANYMTDLKGFAKRYHLILIVCSQINREGRKEGRAELHHLKSSGAIEEASDAVLLCECPTLEKTIVSPDAAAEPTEYKIRIAKHRRGPLSELTFLFHPAIYEFDEPEGGWKPVNTNDPIPVLEDRVPYSDK